MLPEHLKEAISQTTAVTEGWTDEARCWSMAELVLEHKPEVVVELGVFGGRSLIPQAFALRENQRGKIYGVDPWAHIAALEGENPDNRTWWEALDLDAIHNKFMALLRAHRLEPWVVIIRAASQDVAQLFPVIDLLNIDGNHSELVSVRDVEMWVPKVKPGGWIWIDDADWDSTQKALGILDSMGELVRNCGNFRLYRKT